MLISFSNYFNEIIFQNQQENPVSQGTDIQQIPTPNNPPPVRRHQSPWEIIKSFVFRILMIYLVTRFFRRPATITPIGNDTLPINPSIPNAIYTPGNLYTSGDLLVRTFSFLFQT
jgi:hypothetical protein